MHETLRRRILRRLEALPEAKLYQALDYIESRASRELIVGAAFGGGLDHELVNLAVLESRKLPFGLTLLDRGEARLLAKGTHAPALRRGDRFSLLAAPVATVSIRGAKYVLSRARLRRGSRGLGNPVLHRVRLTVHAGRVWLISGR